MRVARETQHMRIALYCKTHKWITPNDAWGKLHITKLSTRIGEMIRKGYEFEKVWVGDREYKKYRLISEPVKEGANDERQES